MHATDDLGVRQDARAAKLRAAIGQRVRELRDERGVTQEGLADQADLHRNYVGSVERGERDVSVTATWRLANALGVSLAEFFAPFKQR